MYSILLRFFRGQGSVRAAKEAVIHPSSQLHTSCAYAEKAQSVAREAAFVQTSEVVATVGQVQTSAFAYHVTSRRTRLPNDHPPFFSFSLVARHNFASPSDTSRRGRVQKHANMGRYTMQAIVESAQLFTQEYRSFAGSEDTIARLLWQASEDDVFRRHVLQILGVSAECVNQQCSSARHTGGPQLSAVNAIPLSNDGRARDTTSATEEEHQRKRKRPNDPRLSPVPLVERLPPTHQTGPDPATLSKHEQPPTYPSHYEPNLPKPAIVRVMNLWTRDPGEMEIRRAFRGYDIGLITVHVGAVREETLVKLHISSRSLAQKIVAQMSRIPVNGVHLQIE